MSRTSVVDRRVPLWPGSVCRAMSTVSGSPSNAGWHRQAHDAELLFRGHVAALAGPRVRERIPLVRGHVPPAHPQYRRGAPAADRYVMSGEE
ncbi:MULTISPECIES: hypothetical protein [unclassified Streptomyces]|uniref:hypothetical protein n=1 Tax=unclassified Streptomyces TaxID=2593676 RepID=UPI0036EBAD5C